MVNSLILSLTSHRRHLCFFFDRIRVAGAETRTDVGFLSLYNGKSGLITSLLLVLKKYYVVSAFYRSNIMKTRKIPGDYFLSSPRRLNLIPQLEGVMRSSRKQIIINLHAMEDDDTPEALLQGPNHSATLTLFYLLTRSRRRSLTFLRYVPLQRREGV